MSIAILPSMEQWLDIFDNEIAAMLDETGVPTNQWRTAGRKTKANPNGDDLNHWRSEGWTQVQAYATWLQTSGWHVYGHNGTPIVEVEVSGELGGVLVKAYIDALLVNPDGQLVVVDYKTGSREAKTILQLGTYRALLKSTLDIDVELGAFYMTRKGLTEPVDLRRFTPDYLGVLFARLQRQLESNDFIPHVGDACFTCDVAASCYAAGGINAYKFDPDHPSYQPLEAT